MSPEISVILPVNRNDGYLTEAIESILSQTFANFELLIIANSCSDSLMNDLAAFKDPRIRIYRTEIAQLPFNLNYGIALARAPYIARMDADDISLPNRLMRQFAFMEENKNISVLGTNYICISETGTLLPQKPTLSSTPQIIKSIQTSECGVAHPTVMARRSDLLEVGGYACGAFAEDYDLWLRMRRSNKQFSNLQDVLFKYRVHQMQSTSTENIQRNLSFTASLKMREFLFTKEFAFLKQAFCDLLKLLKYQILK